MEILAPTRIRSRRGSLYRLRCKYPSPKVLDSLTVINLGIDYRHIEFIINLVLLTLTLRSNFYNETGISLAAPDDTLT